MLVFKERFLLVLRYRALNNNPQVKGIAMRTRIVTPRKPNSARRPTAKIILTNKNRVTAHIPGSGYNIKRHSTLLVHGVGARDLPGVRYTCVRGVYDFLGVLKKTRRRSIYGTPIADTVKRKVRRKYRVL